ncbi:MAG: sulfatase [Verrucomicrobiota bacterium JB024]|nr:sulfatase [Verrucomicrobiota bacterium JB024]
MKALYPLIALLGSLISTQAAPQRPNILFIAVDDLRPTLGCYGDPVAQTPNMNKLASEGTLFERAYCQQAICSPSRISLLSGRYPTETRIFRIGPNLRSTMPDIVTMPQYLKNHGYFTQSLGKIYHGKSIDDPASWSVPSWHSKVPHSGPEGQKAIQAAANKKPEDDDEPANTLRNNPYYAQKPFERAQVGDDELRDGDTARYAVQRLRELAKNPSQPFFLGVGFHRPHLPWVAPEKYWALYDDADVRLPENQNPPIGAPRYAYAPVGELEMYGGTPTPHFHYSETFKRECMQAYLASTSYVDALVGRLMKTLEETGLDKNTIIVLWGDHGYHMGEQGLLGCKHTNYEVATRVPLIIVAPESPVHGQKSEALVELVDIAPTLIQLCGLPPDPGFGGTSLVPILEGKASQVKDIARSWYPRYLKWAPNPAERVGVMGNALRTDRYRFVEWVTKDGETNAIELYDMQNDPEQSRNVATDAENAALVRELSARVRQDDMLILPQSE